MNLATDAALESGAALYDAPSLLRLNAEAAIAAAVETGDATRAAQGAAFAERALGLAPADAYLWSTLAWARLALGDEDGALTALERAWAFAPHNRGLSADRLILAEMLGVVVRDPDDARVAADREALARFSRVDPDGLLLEIEQ